MAASQGPNAIAESRVGGERRERLGLTAACYGVVAHHLAYLIWCWLGVLCPIEAGAFDS
jgi:hypothetical protein